MTMIPTAIPVAPLPAAPGDAASDPTELSEMAASFAALLASLTPLVAPVPDAAPTDAAAPSSGEILPVAAAAVPGLSLLTASVAAPVAPAPTVDASPEVVPELTPEVDAPAQPAPVAAAPPPPPLAPVAAPVAAPAALAPVVTSAVVAAVAQPAPENDVPTAQEGSDDDPDRQVASPAPVRRAAVAEHVDVVELVAPVIVPTVAPDTDEAPDTEQAPTAVDDGAQSPAPVAVPTERPAPRVEAPATRAPDPVTRPHMQVVNVVTPLVRRGDGNYRIGLELRPEHLGRVQIDVHVIDGSVHVTMHADTPASADVLRASLSDLRTELEAAGVHAGNLDVSGQPGWQAPDQQAFRQQAQAQPMAIPYSAVATSNAVEDTTADPAAKDGSLDVLV